MNGGNNADYRLRLTGGLVASALHLGYDQMPTDGDDWYLGVIDEPIQAKVEIVAVVTAPNGQRTVSKAVLEVNVDRSYAINGWTVDPNASGPVILPTPDPNPVDPPPVDPPPVDPPPVDPPPVDPPPVDPPPVDPPPVDPCADAEATWTAQYWNDASPSDRLTGTPDLVRQDATIDFDWGNGAPDDTDIGIDDFSARWTRKLALTEPGTYRFILRGDDGLRLFVNGAALPLTKVDGSGSGGSDSWSDHAVTSYAGEIALSGCVHDVVMEFYEASGQAEARLAWTKVG